MSKMILHVCCASCALPVIAYLLETEKYVKSDLILLFYNPNIYPEAEEQKRLSDVEKISKIFDLKLSVISWDHEFWKEYLKKELDMPLEEYQENGLRCQACFRYRLKEVYDFALKNSFDFWATTLSVNRFKDVRYINDFCLGLGQNIKYKIFNLDPNVANNLSLKMSKTYNIYCQKYCGCEYSMNNSFLKKKLV